MNYPFFNQKNDRRENFILKSAHGLHEYDANILASPNFVTNRFPDFTEENHTHKLKKKHSNIVKQQRSISDVNSEFQV